MNTNRLLPAFLLCLAAAAPTLAQTSTPKLLSPDPAILGERFLEEWPPFLHWDLREFPSCRVPWAMSPNAVPDLDGDGTANDPDDRTAALNAFEASFNSWDAVGPALIGFVQTGTPPSPGGVAMDGFNTIGFGDHGLDDVQVVPVGTPIPPGTTLVWAGPNNILETQPGGDDIVAGLFVVEGGNGIAETYANTWGSVAGALAHAGLFFNNQSGVIIECDITFDTGFTWVVNPATNDCAPPVAFNVRGTAVHEIGHFIGIAHPLFNPSGVADTMDGNAPTMAAVACTTFGGNNYDQTLENSDRDSCNFLYCPDLGDAPDPWMGVFNLYPSIVREVGKGRTLNGLKLDKVALGAEHIFGIKPRNPFRNWTYEWLGITPASNVNAEHEARIVDRDVFEDGVTWYPNPPVWGRTMRVKQWIRYASDAMGFAHDYAAHPLYANAWLDVNQNCIWEEHFMSVAKSPAPPIGPNQVRLTTATGSIGLPPFVNPNIPVWLRCRLDYGENVGGANAIDPTLNLDKGAAQLGEVEDYPFYCTTRYQVQRLCNPYPFPIFGTVMVFVGPVDPADAVMNHIVDAGDCVVALTGPPSTTYVPSADETIVHVPTVTLIPPFTYLRTGTCRPNNPPKPPQTKVRSNFVTEEVPESTPAMLVPAELRIPTVNCELEPASVEFPDLVFLNVGAVDFANGGWIDGPDSVTGEWSDTLRVSVSYRVSPNLIPLEGLNQCDPAYTALPLTFVGTGDVTPETGFRFTLNRPDDVPDGHYVILEVTSSWSTNELVNYEIIEFDAPVGTPTDVETPAVPTRLALENYPNPFNPNTTIRFALPNEAKVTLAVYDVAGRLVRTLVSDRKYRAGVFEAEWNGRDARGEPVASGVYFYRLNTGAETLTRKAVLLK